MNLAGLLGVAPILLAPALVGVFLFTLGQALVARRLLGLPSPLPRVAFCALLGVCVTGPTVGRPMAAPGWQWHLIPVLWGATLAATMLALLLFEYALPSHGPGLVRDTRRRIGRVRRYLRVGSISARHGLPRFLASRPRRDTPLRNREFAGALRRSLEDGGVTFVKLGQFLATRRDLLPEEFVRELGRLHDDVPPAPWADVRRQLCEELGAPPEEVFAAFDETPFAAASIAQVHRATLADGRRVVVKVRRPGIVRTVAQDLDIVRRAARSLDRRHAWARALDATALAEGFAESLTEELDFRIEARNLDAVRAAAGAHPTVTLPEVHGELSGARVLVLEHLDGVPLGRARTALAERGVDGAAPARTLLTALLRQITVAGVFHADPHPGNVLLMPDDTLALVDFGSVGHLDSRLRSSLRHLLVAVDRRDPAALRDAFLDLVDRPDGVDGEALERALGRFAARHLGPGRTADLALFADLFRLVTAHGVAVPGEIAAVFRALATLEGTLAQLSPGFDILAEARAFATEQIAGLPHPDAVRRTLAEEFTALLPVLRRIPRRAERITADIERGKLTLNVRLFAHAEDERVIGRLLRQALAALLAATTGITAALLLSGTGGPRVTDTLRLHDLLGYHLLVLSLVLVLRVMVGSVGRSSPPRGR
ncbi:ABC1 kinase family protein (plasmid) [Streptomyces sp. BI20]|uniref:ABC1 kinase family protein n=1 Tax=Streptomyces sp. BI20 TaxID=3403460 RepID=UPI003C73595E